MRAWLASILQATLPAESVESYFECSWCHLAFEDRPAACPECRGLVVRVVVR